MTNLSELRETLRQMLAVLEAERQALAEMNLEAILGAADTKQILCGKLGGPNDITLDEECRSLVDSARRQNDVNRQMRNLVAANVSARLDALTGSRALYEAGAASGYAVAHR